MDNKKAREDIKRLDREIANRKLGQDEARMMTLAAGIGMEIAQSLQDNPIKVEVHTEPPTLHSLSKLTIEGLPGPQGIPGLSGEPGKDSDPNEVASLLLNNSEFIEKTKAKDGEPGKTPTQEELVDIIKPLIPVPKKGKDADPSEIALVLLSDPEFISKCKGEPGEPGQDGSSDTPDEVVDKVNAASNKILASQIKDLPDMIGAFIPIGGGRSSSTSTSSGGGHTIEDEGVALTQRASLNFVGAGVTAADSGGKTVVTIPGGAGSPGGSDTEVQFNDAGSFNGDAGLTFNKTTNKLTVTGDTAVGGAVEIGHASDTTLSRIEAGVVGVEGFPVVRVLSATRPNETLTNSTTSDQDYTSIYTIPANYLTTAKMIRVILSIQLTTGTSSATLGLYMKIGSTKVYGIPTPTNIGDAITRSFNITYLIVGTAAPGASVAVEASGPSTSWGGGGTGQMNSIAQPVAGIATDGALAIVPGAVWNATGSTENLTVLSALVEGLN